MLFNSYIFVLLFLPVSLVGWFLLNKCKSRMPANLFLVGMSLWFYGYFNPGYLWILGSSIVGNYLISRVLCRPELSGRVRKAVLAAGILANGGCIFYYKYFDFFISNINSLFGQEFVLLNIVLPLGISFFTFQQISFLVDSYRGETREYGFVEYALFVSFFPQLVAGPIVLHREMIPQFRKDENRHFQGENLSRGLYIFARGLFKKVLIADTFGLAVSAGYEVVPYLSSMEAVLVSVAYTLQLYFDFSGYCDMAIGIGAMFNIQLPQNFNSPYKAVSIMDFWDRWHMSLTRFLREYIYFPLGGSREGKAKTYGNIMIVYLVSGIWHGANWTFVLWGALHGVLNCINRACQKYWDRLFVAIRWLITFAAVNLLWIFFRAESVSQAIVFMGRIFGGNGFGVGRWLTECFDLAELQFAERAVGIYYKLMESMPGIHAGLFFVLAFVVVLFGKNSSEVKFRPTLARALGTIILLVWSIVSFTGVSEFLYFNF